MDTINNHIIRQLFDDYLRMYASRDERLTQFFSEDFSGITGSGEELTKDLDEWIAITRQDFAQVKDPLRIELKDLVTQSLSDTIAVATSSFIIHLPIKDHILSRKITRLTLIFRKESAGWRICHCSFSVPFATAQEGEIFPLQELVIQNQLLEKHVAEQTAELLEANSKLNRTNEYLEKTISEQRQTEEALRESESKYRLLTENASDVVWRLDSAYRFTYISPADERLRGYKADEMIGHHVFEIFNEEGVATIKSLAEQRFEAEQRGIIQTETITFEAEHRCNDGGWLWAEVRYSAERDADGKAVGFCGITREITERKLAEEESLKAKAVAEEASKAKSQFLATMSHEIRTPLNSLVGFSTLARKITDPAKIDQYLEILEQSSLSLMDLVNNILDISKSDAGRLELEATPINLRQFISNLEEQYHHLANQKMLKFQVTVDDRIPNWVLGDPIRLRQTLTNLLANAVKFTESGEVSCSISCYTNVTDQQLIRFEVRDSGIGIPDSFLPDIFRPFRQLDPTISRKFGGTGLGLAIVHSLVEIMKGTITVSSREWVGSCFVVDLPLQETEPLSEELAAAPVKLAQSAILVVEDNSFNRQLMGDLLTSWGHLVSLAENGHQALTLAGERNFDLILLDIRMPGIDGIEVATRIRQQERERAEKPVPIIAITADADAATREACLVVGINAVLAKPVLPEQLARAIAAHCGGAMVASVGSELLNSQTSRELGSDPERARQYRELLLHDIDEELQNLQRVIEGDDRKALGRAAHSLKGLCAHLANPEPAKLAAWLQHNAAIARHEQIRSSVEQLVHVIRQEQGARGKRHEQ